MLTSKHHEVGQMCAHFLRVFYLPILCLIR